MDFITVHFKVALDHHHKDMILINWVMSTILISWMIFVNLPGKQKVLSKLYVKKIKESVLDK